MVLAYPKVTHAIPAIDKQNKRILRSPAVFATGMKRNTSRLKSRWVAAKRVEPPAAQQFAPFRYKSTKQRRLVHAKRRERGGGAYVRTHELSRSAFVDINVNENGGNVITGYKSPIAQFVLTKYRQPMFDPRFGGVPWQNPTETDAKFVQETMVVIRETWKTAADERAGVR